MTIEFESVDYSPAAAHRRSPPRAVLRDLNFAAEPSEVFAIIGESGVGKTTILRLICGLERPSSGQVLHDGKPVSGPSRRRGMVFQDYDVFEWMTVRANVEFAARRVEGSATSRSQEVDRLLHSVELDAKADDYPRQLSGGMRQRLAIIRALAAQPAILCLDEPFSALDPITKEDVRKVIVDAAERSNITLVVVSHDILMAVGTSDRGVVLACAENEPARICANFTGFRSSYDGLPTEDMVAVERDILTAMRGPADATCRQKAAVSP